MSDNKKKAVLKKAKIADTPVSVKDFLSWLSGVEDMQEEGWYPSAEQWARIRSKIELLEDNGTSYVEVRNVPQHNRVVQHVPQQHIPHIPHNHGPSAIDLNKEMTPRGFIPDPPHVGGSLPPVNLATNVGAIKTPDLPDTDYVSGFV
jgi:hypothetical protein